MKKYVLLRLLKSIISILVVVSIVIVMVYTMIPVRRMLSNDTAFTKLKGITRQTYMYSKMETLGYIDYLSLADMCKAESSDVKACLTFGSGEQERVAQIYRDRGYAVETIEEIDEKDNHNQTILAHYDYSAPQLVVNFFKRLIVIDGPWKVQDQNNPNLERGYSFGLDHNNVPAIMCSGCEHKYQLYFDLNFPFIHQNVIGLDFGQSYPINVGVPTLDVIGNGQGSLKSTMQTFPTGLTANSPIMQHTCKYKTAPDHLDQQRFNDNYSNCQLAYDSPSMISTSYLFGIASLILAYLIALPFGISMAQHKGQLIDKIGIAWINILIAVPSLAFIFFLKYIGLAFGLPDKFPQYGFGDPRSYILPILILALLNTSSLMMWIRRYMVDQSNADYVKFARAKGLSQKEIFKNHVLKNAIIPIVNGIPASVILCISGAVITESVFAIPGMGKMLPDSIKAVNINMVVTLTFIFTVLSVFAVFAGDLLMTVVDPRIQLATKGND